MNLKENFYSVKRGIIKKALPLALAASIALGTPMGETKAKAYNLEEPSISYDDFKDYDYKIIFLGGRLMEFNKETGHPYKKSKKVMIPVESLCKSIYGVYNYDSKKETATIKRHGVTYTFKKGSKKITVNDHGKKTTIKTKVANTIKSGKLYAQLSSVADAFKLTLKSDKKTGIINLNYKYDYENIDLKNNENNLVDLKKVKTSQYDKVMLDMTEIQPDYINVLKNTSQYKAFIEVDHRDNKKTLWIFSYQLFENIDYIYSKKKELDSQWYSEDKKVKLEDVSVTLENIVMNEEVDDEEILYGDLIRLLATGMRTKRLTTDLKNGTVQKGISNSVTHDQYLESLAKAREIIDAEKDWLEQNDVDDLLSDLALNIRPWYIKPGTGKNYHTALNKGTADCVGYQAALELLCRVASEQAKDPKEQIFVVNVSGALHGDGHRYGYAYYKGKWYVVDAANNIHNTIDKEKEEGLRAIEDRDTELTKELVMKTYKFYDNK